MILSGLRIDGGGQVRVKGWTQFCSAEVTALGHSGAMSSFEVNMHLETGQEERECEVQV